MKKFKGSLVAISTIVVMSFGLTTVSAATAGIGGLKVGSATAAPETTSSATDETASTSDGTTTAASESTSANTGTGNFADSTFVVDEDATIYEGVYAGKVNLGGMNPAQAREAITDYEEQLLDGSFTITSNGKSYTTSLRKLGFSYDLSTIVEESAYLGRHGLLIQRYKDITDLKYDSKTIDIPYTVSDETFNSYIENNVSESDTPCKNATITRQNGEFVITNEETGITTDKEATKQAILTALKTDAKTGMSIEAVTKVDTPTITASALSVISDTLGTYSTKYGSSKSGRKTNIKVASSNIGGTVLLPGQSLSASDKMKKRDPENGYQLATEYNNGESVEAYGGGVCQVATTLYQAALRAELQIDERHNHSMLVSYVDPSYDAAISWGNKDLQFTNNTENPIYISAIADGETLTFTIYGKEYRASNRTISFESVVTKRTKSETKVVEDSKLAKGTETVKGNNHDGCESYLVKKVYVDGKLTDTIKFASDSYQASYKVITRGTMVETTAAATTAAAESTKATKATKATEATKATKAKEKESSKAAESSLSAEETSPVG